MATIEKRLEQLEKRMNAKREIVNLEVYSTDINQNSVLDEVFWDFAGENRHEEIAEDDPRLKLYQTTDGRFYLTLPECADDDWSLAPEGSVYPGVIYPNA